MRIGVVLGSVRQGRNGEGVARWVHEGLVARGGAEVELLDLAAFDVPLYTEAGVPMALNRQYASPEVGRWAAAVDACDAYVFVTPEYNHSVPGPFKNAVDSIGPEWVGKPVAFVSYGADNGVRAVEHWRQIVANFQMIDVRAQVSLGLFTDFADGAFAPAERRAAELGALADQLFGVLARLGVS